MVHEYTWCGLAYEQQQKKTLNSQWVNMLAYSLYVYCHAYEIREKAAFPIAFDSLLIFDPATTFLPSNLTTEYVTHYSCEIHSCECMV